ncbi:BA75_03165T0 [Komagataella pastoris]|uniref:alcohol oxidase n=1 Tax=Komagataella pastoris TaxID=4922 RepID=A0A1B2JBK5_PICPA|nr:BA75_03165T0 [Komagataella pastoris]
MAIPEEFDILVLGGGSSGSCIAGRLANLDHSLKVGLIEAGENNLNNPWVYLPGIYPRNMKLDSKTASFYTSNPSPHLNGRRAIVPCANILGGGSSINFMMYTRGSASDYDDFEAEGWKTKDLLPLMKKTETYQRACNNPEIHGFEGPIKVSFGNYTYPVCQDFLRATESQGIPYVDDLEDLETAHGAEHWLKWINRDTGRRSDSAHAFVHSTMRNHDNLYLICNTKVDKIIVEDGRAAGVRTVPSKPLNAKKPTHKVYRARKQIVLSCGTISSPLVLQRSGFGDPIKLRAAGVKPLVNLPGVGRNFQDHYCFFSPYRIKPQYESFDDFVRGDANIQKKVFDQWYANGTGPLATNGIEAGVKIRPTPEELSQMDESFQEGYREYFEDKPDKPVMHYSIIAGFFGDHTKIPPGKYMTMFHFLEYPFSRGSIHITSPDPYATPDFDPGFMNDERDMAPMVWSYKKSRETARKMDHFAGEVTSHHPLFPYSSEARAYEMDLETSNAYGGPLNLTAGLAHGSWTQPLKKPAARNEGHVTSNQVELHPDIEYDEEDDKAIENYIREHTETTWHCLGTCSIGPREGSKIVKWGGVLDHRSNVYGVKGLKVGDLSVCPDNVGCNTYTTALLIGEKTATLVGEDLGYTGDALDMTVPQFKLGTYEKTGLARF